jgi:hypothetical protein
MAGESWDPMFSADRKTPEARKEGGIQHAQFLLPVYPSDKLVFPCPHLLCLHNNEFRAREKGELPCGNKELSILYNLMVNASTGSGINIR